MKSSLLLLALLGLACYRQPPLGEPFPNATEVTYPDSERTVLAAATQAIVDEGLSVQTEDTEHRWVTSRMIDIGQLSHLSPSAVDTYVGADRVVRFRFVVRRTFGATTLYGEVLYEPAPGGGQRSERPVPTGNPARAVLARMITRIGTALSDARSASRPGD
jgi:hypothetical protein